MKMGRVRINIYLFLAAMLLLASLSGCNTPEGQRKKLQATFALFEEVNPRNAPRSQQVPIYRAQPVSVTIEKMPFLTEAQVKEAKVVDAVGGFALRIQFDRQGAWLFEQYTSVARGRRIAIFSHFMEPGQTKLNAGRWLAAPQFFTAVKDGVLSFTPDATREEAERIADGLNNAAKKFDADRRWD